MGPAVRQFTEAYGLEKSTISEHFILTEEHAGTIERTDAGTDRPRFPQTVVEVIVNGRLQGRISNPDLVAASRAGPVSTALFSSKYSIPGIFLAEAATYY